MSVVLSQLVCCTLLEEPLENSYRKYSWPGFEILAPHVLSLVLNQCSCFLSPHSAFLCCYLQDSPFSKGRGSMFLCCASSLAAASPWKKESIKSDEGDFPAHAGQLHWGKSEMSEQDMSRAWDKPSGWSIFFVGCPGFPRSIQVF